MTRIQFAEETQVTVGDLRVGDFICTIPTQARLRGTKFDSGIKALTHVNFKNGHPGYAIKTLASRDDWSGGTCYPLHFICTVRRQIAE